MTNCLFCRIIEGKEKSWTIYEDDLHTGFLTPFPNTPGFAVLVTKEHLDSQVLSMKEERYTEFLKAARRLGNLLDLKLGTKRTGLIIEGMGVDHAHIKLVPMHGIPNGPWNPIRSSKPEYNEIYEGYLTSKDGPRMRDDELDVIAKKITS